ncbi:MULTISPECIES: hypothetical protein [Micromonospora]|uniref:PE domain-containing protein n=1 Tax=Micromonospora musae TaxID=1894970 RepID=A0A3A9XT41_9ACTN|nr:MULTISPECIES: hypothetical protein [Micromonospora]RKN23682.1 hypothetical protein D7147_01110 [Micromonospora musae]RKN28348.1 hypothetical protein D7044_26200 [Micromonospora musae]TYB91970.1 hypothetical protein FXF53_29205 [Micromonospora sp. WP24]
MIPGEDRPPAWLSGYGSIDADIRQLREFADRLTAEVERNYAPHLPRIAEDVTAPLPNPCDAFIELVHFLQAHHETQQASVDMVWGVCGATGHLAAAAGTVADRYAGADAFSAARVADVEHALANPRAVGAAGPPSVLLGDPTGPENGPAVNR